MIEIPLAHMLAYSEPLPFQVRSERLRLQLEEIERSIEQRKQYENTFMPNFAEAPKRRGNYI